MRQAVSNCPYKKNMAKSNMAERFLHISGLLLTKFLNFWRSESFLLAVFLQRICDTTKSRNLYIDKLVLTMRPYGLNLSDVKILKQSCAIDLYICGLQSC